MLDDDDDDEGLDLQKQVAAATKIKKMGLESMHQSALQVKKMEVDELRRHNEELEKMQQRKMLREERLNSVDAVQNEIALFEEMKAKFTLEMIANLYYPRLIVYMRKDELTPEQQTSFALKYKRWKDGGEDTPDGNIHLDFDT